MRLCVISPNYPPMMGGIAAYASGLARAFAKAGHEVTVLALSPHRWRGSIGLESGLRTIRIPRLADRLRGLRARLFCRALDREMQASRPDLILVTNWWLEGLSELLLQRRSLPPVLVAGYGREFLPEQASSARTTTHRAVLGKLAGALAISRFTAAQIAAAGVPEDRIIIVPGGIDPERFQPPPDLEQARRTLSFPTGRTLLTIARLIRRKGVDTVIEALPAIAATVPNVHHVIIGDGPERACLADLADRLGVGERVRFLGAVSDADKVACLHLCDCFVMPSRDIPEEPPEGFGIVYLEANVCGKPVIAARSGGVEDAVEDGVSGRLVDPNRPDQLAKAAIALLTDPVGAREMGERGRVRVVTHFTWPAIADPTLAALARTLGPQGE
jgi:phosphatidylinositol alpha-1,6-mannosyltransferase